MWMSNCVNVKVFLYTKRYVIKSKFVNLMSYLLYNESEKRIAMGVTTKCLIYQHLKLKRCEEDRVLKPCSDLFSLLRYIKL